MSRNTKAVTIKDVAREAGVCLSAASSILNHKPGYSEATRQKVWDVAHALQYHPCPHARGIHNHASGKQTKFRLLMHVFHIKKRDIEQNICEDHLAQYCMFLNYEVQKSNYFLTHYWYNRAYGFRCSLVLNDAVDGILLGVPHLDVLTALKGQVPMVLGNANLSDMTRDMPIVNSDMSGGLNDACRELARRGYRRCALIRDAADIPDRELQPLYEDEMELALRRHHIGIVQDIREYIDSEIHEQVVFAIAQRLIPVIRKREIDLIFTENIDYAQSLLRYLRLADVRIPEEVGLVTLHQNSGYADSDIACIASDWRQVGATGVGLLIDIIEGKEVAPGEYLIPPRLLLNHTLRNLPPREELCS